MSTITSTAHPAADRDPAGAPRTAFVLAGGAALGAMQAGMVHALYERGIVPDLLVGTSAGALNAAFLASRPPTVATAGELAAIWRGLRRSDVLPLRPATLLGGLAGRRGHLVPDHGLRRLATRHMQFQRLEQASIPLHLVAFDLLSGNEVRLSGVQDPSRIDPDNWVLDKALIDRPGVDEIMLDLLYDIPNQAPTFTAMQQFLRERRPPVLVATGASDEIFPEQVRRQILTDHPGAEYHALQTGHFALEDKAAEIAALMRDFLARTVPRA